MNNKKRQLIFAMSGRHIKCKQSYKTFTKFYKLHEFKKSTKKNKKKKASKVWSK